ncbi:hypothetical protein RSSM_06251 [Rhodopirellula sallentina SM41]|uniref:Uncharacterized protein n=1 Tax=Rhodopirellula sallentina SM41 TaxID=1263870 RepID=M5TTD9_9BACT|nr:hypothetical protein RSSM_06251 [Rhodopirellula sallentina SM41]
MSGDGWECEAFASGLCADDDGEASVAIASESESEVNRMVRRAGVEK